MIFFNFWIYQVGYKTFGIFILKINHLRVCCWIENCVLPADAIQKISIQPVRMTVGERFLIDCCINMGIFNLRDVYFFFLINFQTDTFVHLLTKRTLSIGKVIAPSLSSFEKSLFHFFYHQRTLLGI